MLIALTRNMRHIQTPLWQVLRCTKLSRTLHLRAYLGQYQTSHHHRDLIGLNCITSKTLHMDVSLYPRNLLCLYRIGSIFAPSKITKVCFQKSLQSPRQRFWTCILWKTLRCSKSRRLRQTLRWIFMNCVMNNSPR